MNSNKFRHEINGFSIDFSKFIVEDGHLISFDVVFNQKHYVGTFKNPRPNDDFNHNQDFTLWENNVPSYIIDACHDYKDVYINVLPKDELSYGFKALLRDLVFITSVISEYDHNHPLAKSCIYGMSEDRTISLILSERLIDERSESEKMRREFKMLYGSVFLGVYSGGGIYISENLKTEVAVSLRLERLSQNLTLQDVVDKLKKVGISLTTASLSRFENNLRHPDFETLAALFKVLNLDHLDGWLDYFEDEYLDVVDDDEFDNFEFHDIDISDILKDPVDLADNELKVLSDLFVVFYGYLLDYRDRYWIKLSELPLKIMRDYPFNPNTVLKSLAAKGFIEITSKNRSKYISLNFDTFNEPKAIELINLLHSDNQLASSSYSKEL